MQVKPWREIHNFNGSAMRIVKASHQNRGVFEVVLLRSFAIREINPEIPEIIAVPEESAKHWISIKAGEAPPANRGAVINERSDGAIPNQS